MQERQVNEDGIEICFATAMGGTFLLSSLCLNSLKMQMEELLMFQVVECI